MPWTEKQARRFAGLIFGHRPIGTCCRVVDLTATAPGLGWVVVGDCRRGSDASKLGLSSEPFQDLAIVFSQGGVGFWLGCWQSWQYDPATGEGFDRQIPLADPFTVRWENQPDDPEEP